MASKPRASPRVPVAEVPVTPPVAPVVAFPVGGSSVEGSSAEGSLSKYKNPNKSSSALKTTKHHQSNPSNVPGILDSNYLKRACAHTSKSFST